MNFFDVFFNDISRIPIISTSTNIVNKVFNDSLSADRESLKTLFTIFVDVEMIGILEISLKKTSKKFKKRLAMIRFFSDYQVVLIPQL